MRVIICGPAGSGKTTLMNRILEGAYPGTLVLDEMPATPPILTAGSFWIIVTQDLERIPILTRAASTMLYTATPGSDHKFDVAFNRAAPLRYSL
jgi:GTPase SAR1 family protein